MIQLFFTEKQIEHIISILVETKENALLLNVKEQLFKRDLDEESFTSHYYDNYTYKEKTCI